MAKKVRPLAPPTTYELLAQRIQRLTLSPRALLEHQVVIARTADELEEDWRLLLEQLSKQNAMTITPHEDGSVHLTWPKPDADGSKPTR